MTEETTPNAPPMHLIGSGGVEIAPSEISQAVKVEIVKETTDGD